MLRASLGEGRLPWRYQILNTDGETGGTMEPWWLWKTAAGTDAQEEHRTSGRRLGASQAHLQVREVLIPSEEGVEPWAPGKFCRQEGPVWSTAPDNQFEKATSDCSQAG